MPNWCSNHLTLRHPDPEMIEKVAAAFNEGKLFNSLVPMPEELRNTTSPSDQPNADLIAKYGYDNWRDWSINNWGTKWEANSEEGAIVEQSENEIVLVFDTAWAPPIEFYETIEDQDWDVRAHYFEPGMMFCGTYEDGDNDEFKIGEDEIPDELEEMFEVSSWIDSDEDEGSK